VVLALSVGQQPVALRRDSVCYLVAMSPVNKDDLFPNCKILGDSRNVVDEIEVLLTSRRDHFDVL
jgi:hypothetical protein